MFDDSITRRLGIKQGALVKSVVENSGADAARIQTTYIDGNGVLHLGDVIVEVAGRPILNASDVQKALIGKKAGEEVTIAVARQNRTLKLNVRLQAPRK